MKENRIEYRIYENSNRLNEILLSEINESLFKKRFNLSGDISNDNTIEVYNCVSLIVFKPNLGPLIKLNVNVVNENNKETESLLKLERINGLSFYVQYFFSLIFISITFLISLYYIITTGFKNIESLFLPIVGIVYFFIIKLIANSSTKGLISKIESMLKIEKIRYVKI